MAVTVEELQILLKCDATQAQTTLETLTKNVDKVVQKLQKSGDIRKTAAQAIEKATKPKSDKSDETYYDKFQKKMRALAGEANDAWNKFYATGDRGAAANYKHAIDQMEKLKEEFYGVADAGEKALKAQMGLDSPKNSSKDRQPQEPAKEPTVEYRGQDGSKKPWQDQWSAVSQSDLMSGYGGDMMRRAAAWMNNAQNDLGAKFQTVDTSKLTGGTQYEQLAEKLKVAENQAESLRSKIESIGSGGDPAVLMRLQTQLDTAEKKAEKLAKQMAAIEDGVGGGASADASAQGMRDTGNAAEEATPKINNYNKAVKETGKSSSFFSKASKFAHGMFDKFGKSFKHHEGFLSKFGKTLKRVMMRMLAMGLIRGVINGIRQGLQLLTKSNAEAATQFGRFSAMAKGVKIALGSAALAALNAIAGILFTIASAAIAAANAIARFFAVLGGGGTYFATTMSDSFDDLSDSIGGAGGAAKGLLADFDELNIIGQQGGGGGGGGLSGTGGITSSEETAISHLADLLKAEQFEEAGAYIAEKLDGIVLKIDEFFIKLDGKHYGTKFAEIVNGIFSDKKLFEDSGKTVGDGINAVIHAFDEFTETFDGKQAGDALAAGVNTMVDTVDWESAGDSVSQGLNKITDAITSFFTNFKGDKLGEKLATAISKAITGTDTIQIGVATVGMVLNAIDFLLSFLGNMDWIGIFSGLIEFIISAPLQIIAAVLSRPSRLLNICKNFIKSFIKILGTLIIGPISGFWNFVTDAMIAGANAVFPGLGDKLFGDARGLSDKITKGFEEGLDAMLAPMDEVAAALDEKMGNMGESTDEMAAEAAAAFEKSRNELSRYTDAIDTMNGKLAAVPKVLSTQYTLNVSVAYDDSGRNSFVGGNLANITILKMASGGLAYGNTFANIGEYPNAKSNPEVVAPLSKLQDILAKSSNNSADVKRQNELLTEQNRLLRIISQKELVVGASAELGQVVKQSQALFGAV